MTKSKATKTAERIDRTRNDFTAEEISTLDGMLDAAKSDLKIEIRDLKILLHEVGAGIHAVRADMARMAFLVEDQNNRNKLVLDAYNATLRRQNELDERLTAAEEAICKLSAARPVREPA